MTGVLRLIDEPDLVWMVILIALLYWVGGHMVADRADLARKGWRVSAGAFVGYGIYGIAAFGVGSAEDGAWIVVRGLLAAGLAVGLAWIALAVLAFIHETIMYRVRMRIRKNNLPATVSMVSPSRTPLRPKIVEPTKRFRERFRDFVTDEKERLDDRCEGLKVLKEIDIFPNEQITELAANELQQFVKRISDGLKDDQSD